MSGFTPSSGQISLANLQSVFGGTNPINFSEYYQNAATGYTSGVSGIPTIGTQISLSNFYNKTKQGVSYPPAAVQTNQAIFGIPLTIGVGTYMHVTGASGINLTRTGGSTFNNIRSSTSSSPGFINCQNLILQAKAGDLIKIQVERWAFSTSTFNNSTILYLNLGTGWFILFSYNRTTGVSTYVTNDFYYTIPTSLPPGNYGIAAVHQYGTLTAYTTCRFYSLHVVA